MSVLHTCKTLLLTGFMFLNGTRRIATTYTENLSLLLTIVANIIIPVANAYSIYTYWKPVYTVYIVVPLLILDAVYRVALIKWYIHGVTTEDVRDSESVQQENPPPAAIEESVPRGPAAIEETVFHTNEMGLVFMSAITEPSLST